jgi:drug/metabolite transporter (DMT)-like permease
MFSQRQKGILILLVSVVCFATFTSFTRLIYNNSSLQPTDVGFWRFLSASVVMWGILLFRNGTSALKPPIPLWQIGIMGVLYCGAALAAFFALQYIPGGLFVVIVYTNPAMIALYLRFRGEKLSLFMWLAIGMTILGVALTVPDWRTLQGGSLLGMSIAFAGAFFVAAYYLFTQRIFQTVSDMPHMTAWMLSSTTVMIGISTMFFGLRAPQTLEVVGLLLALGIICTVIAIFTLNMGLQLVGASQTSIVSSLEPVGVMIIAFLVVGERFTFVQLLGAGFIMGAVIVLQLSPKKK